MTGSKCAFAQWDIRKLNLIFMVMIVLLVQVGLINQKPDKENAYPVQLGNISHSQGKANA